MLIVDVDQFTMVIKPAYPFEYDDWRYGVAIDLIDEFIDKSKICYVLGNIVEADKNLPSGYTEGYTIENSLYYFSIAFNEAMPNMGVIVKFSGHAWSVYMENYEKIYGERMNLWRFFSLINSDLYEYRLSRIDPFVDFINEGINVAKIKKSIEAGRSEIRYGKSRQKFIREDC